MMMTMMTMMMTMTTTAPGGHCLIAHIMIWMSLPERNKKHIGNGIDEEVAALQAKENLVSQTNLNSSHHHDNHKYDYHKYDFDLPVNKLDPFTTAAYVHKCVHEKLFPCCKFFRINQDVDQFMAMVFDKIGMGGFTPDNHYKQMTSWVAIRQFIKKGQMISDSCVSIDGTLRQKVSHPLLS